MKKNKYSAILILALIALPFMGTAQKSDEEADKKNTFLINLGATYIPDGTSVGTTGSSGFFIPIVGIDYLYRVAKKWEIGLMVEMQLGDYLIIEGDLNREYALDIVVIGSYRATEELHLFGGAGIEIDKNRNLAILRIGVEYNFSLGKGWLLAPNFMYDFKEGLDTWSLALAFGKEF